MVEGEGGKAGRGVEGGRGVHKCIIIMQLSCTKFVLEELPRQSN